MTRQALTVWIESRCGRSRPTPASRPSTPPANRATLENLRLWDWRALQDTLRQIQEIRTYYDFPDIDIDRYEIGGTRAPGDARHPRAQHRQAAGEQPQLDQREADLHPRLRRDDEPGQRFHARRAADAPRSATCRCRASPPAPTVTRPEIYFGELTNTDVYVKTRQKEFNYPQGDTNSVDVVRRHRRHRARRILPPLAASRSIAATSPSCRSATTSARTAACSCRRNVRERVEALAPFLDVRLRSLHRRRRRRTAVVDDGRVHDVGELPVLASLSARPDAGQLHPQQRQGRSSTPTTARRRSTCSTPEDPIDRRIPRTSFRRSSRTRRPMPPVICASTCAIPSCCSNCRRRSTACTT